MIASHYLPAAYIGRFSSSNKGRARERRVWVLRARSEEPHLTRADRIGLVRGLYRNRLATGLDLEDNWGRYERDLPAALDLLAAGGPIPADVWLHTLVPFTTAMLVRGPEFSDRHRRRLPGVDDLIDDTGARVMELQRRLSVVMASRWTVMASPHHALVGNDVGRAPALIDGSLPGIVIPLDPSRALSLAFGRSRTLCRWDGAKWLVDVEHTTLDREQARSLNEVAASVTLRFVYGPDRELVADLKSSIRRAMEASGGMAMDHLLDPLSLTDLSKRLLIAHEFEWWRVAAALTRTPEDLAQSDLSAIDWAAVPPDRWRPPAVMLPANLPEFPTGLTLVGERLDLALDEIPGFTQP